jgi:hypothetical protein
MPADECIVQIKLARLPDSLELNKYFLGFLCSRNFEVLAIPRDAG